MPSHPDEPADEPALQQELRTCREALAGAQRARLAFLAQIGHELRTPMNAVMGFAQLMLGDRGDPLSAGHRARTEQLLAAGDELLTLFDALTDIEQLACGVARLSLEPVALGPMLADCVNRLQDRAQRARVAISGPLGCRGACVALADRLRLRRLMGALLSGALRSTAAGGQMGLTCGCEGLAGAPADAAVSLSLSGHGFAPITAEPLIAAEPLIVAMQGRLEQPVAGDGGVWLRITLPRAPAQSGESRAG